MSNYPDDIGQYIWHPGNPFYEDTLKREPVECDEDYESEGDDSDWCELLC